MGIAVIIIILILCIIELTNIRDVWRYIWGNKVLKDGIPMSFKGSRLSEYTSKHGDHILIFPPIYAEVKKLFTLVCREKKKHTKLTANYENIFIECKRAIFNLWWLHQSPAVVSQKEREIIDRLTPAIIPSVKNLTELYRYSSDIPLKQVDFLINNYNGDAKEFYERIYLIDEAEVRVVVSREIQLQAYRFLVSHNRTYSLMCYLQYLNITTYSDTFKHRAISTKYDKLLFKNKEQKKYFEDICKQLIASKDITKAIKSLEKISGVKKKIELNFKAIKEANKEQLEVAKVLGQYLSEDETNKEPLEVAKVLGQYLLEEEEAISHQVSLPEDKQPDAELTELFISGGFRLSKQEVLLFAQERKLLPSQLIQKINEEHYEALDDLLIEEEEELYTMSEEYCKRLGLQE